MGPGGAVTLGEQEIPYAGRLSEALGRRQVELRIAERCPLNGRVPARAGEIARRGSIKILANLSNLDRAAGCSSRIPGYACEVVALFAVEQ